MKKTPAGRRVASEGQRRGRERSGTGTSKNGSRPGVAAVSATADRRTAILDATLRVIAAHGIDAVTHRRVAAVADVPLGSTTYYFESRGQLLRDAFRRYLDQIRELQTSVARSRPKTTVAGLVDYLVELTQREFEDEQMVLAEYELTLFAARDADIAEALHHWDAFMIGHLADAFETMGAPRPFDAARTVLHLMRGHELDSLSRHESRAEDLRRRLAVVVAALVGDSDSQSGRERAAARVTKNRR